MATKHKTKPRVRRKPRSPNSKIAHFPDFYDARDQFATLIKTLASCKTWETQPILIEVEAERLAHYVLRLDGGNTVAGSVCRKQLLEVAKSANALFCAIESLQRPAFDYLKARIQWRLGEGPPDTSGGAHTKITAQLYQLWLAARDPDVAPCPKGRKSHHLAREIASDLASVYERFTYEKPTRGKSKCFNGHYGFPDFVSGAFRVLGIGASADKFAKEAIASFQGQNASKAKVIKS